MEIPGGAPIKLSSMFITPAGYKKYRHASWRTERRSAVLPGRRLVVPFPLAHFACVVSPGYRISERGEGGQATFVRSLAAVLTPTPGMLVRTG